MRSRVNASILVACALSRFRRDRKGAAAIEFAMIGIPFLMMLFAIIETAMMFFATQVLESATQDSARLIMTGQAQLGAMSASQFKANLCARLVGLFDCTNGVDIEVTSYPTFAAVNPTNPLNNGVYTPPSGYSPGSAGQIVVVRTFYQWPVFVSGFGYNPGNVNGNKRLLGAVAAFRNEPGPF
jgi:Flp pilus assembly protein TadG